MIVQLPCGRFIECSLEQYLSLSDDELAELNGLPFSYTKEYTNPFYNSYVGKTPVEPEQEEEKDGAKDLNEIEKNEKLSDKYFHSDDV